MAVSAGGWLTAVLLLLVAGASAAALELPLEQGCSWHGVDSRAGISSWEFQLRIAPDRNASLSRIEWLQFVEQSFATVHARLPGVAIQPLSRRTMVWHEVERAVSTGDGKPLDRRARREGVEYPFSQIGVLRLRHCLAVDAAEPGSAAHLLLPGQSDLTLKLKGIDPESPPDWDKSWATSVRGAQLAVKRENDVHCTFQRVSWSAVYRRAEHLSPHMLRQLKRVSAFFPDLPKLLHLGNNEELPPHLDHHQSKTYWDASYGGVQGTVQLYAESPDKATALDGSASWPQEVSMRVMRSDAAGEEELQRALELMGAAGDVLESIGWTALPPAASGESGRDAAAADALSDA